MVYYRTSNNFQIFSLPAWKTPNLVDVSLEAGLRHFIWNEKVKLRSKLCVGHWDMGKKYLFLAVVLPQTRRITSSLIQCVLCTQMSCIQKSCDAEEPYIYVRNGWWCINQAQQITGDGELCLACHLCLGLDVPLMSAVWWIWSVMQLGLLQTNSSHIAMK